MCVDWRLQRTFALECGVLNKMHGLRMGTKSFRLKCRPNYHSNLKDADTADISFVTVIGLRVTDSVVSERILTPRQDKHFQKAGSQLFFSSFFSFTVTRQLNDSFSID